MIRNHLTVLAAAALFAAAAGGCGNDVPGETRSDAGPPDMPAEAAAAPAEREDAARDAPQSDSQSDTPWGESLAEPDLYFGLYATEEDPGREWFITEARRPPYAERVPEIPPGHLSLGAMFGDVAPWHLRTLSDTEFVQASLGPGQKEPIAIEFELDDSGRAEAFRFTGGEYSRPGRFVRVGELPEGW